MKDYILDIIHLNNDFTGQGMYMALYFIALMFIAFYVKDKKYKLSVLYPALLLLTGVYILIPFVNRFITSVCDDDVRGRFSWVLMLYAVAGLFMTLFVIEIKEWKKQLLAIGAFLVVIFLSGVFQITDYRFQKAENLYKLPNVYIELSDCMLAEQRELGESQVNIVVPYEAAYAFRQYSTDINMLYGEDATYGRIWAVYDERRDVCDTMQTTCPDLALVNEVARDYDMQYIIFDTVYTDFGGESINIYGLSEDENFVGDRTPDAEVVERMRNTVKVDTATESWDLSEYGLEYVDRFERYLLYRYK